MSREASELYGYITSIEPVVKRGLLFYRARITSLGDESWEVYLRGFSRDFKLGCFAKIKPILSRQRDEEKLIVDEIEILEEVERLKPEEVTIEEVSRDNVTVITGWRNRRFFSLPIKDKEVLEKIPRELPAKVITLFIETSRGIKLASIISEKEYKIMLRAEELLSLIEEGEKRSEKFCEEQLELGDWKLT
ncbi:MAG: hypothetical protein ABDH32_06220 [Candidatus Caldarchaeales archaeon]